MGKIRAAAGRCIGKRFGMLYVESVSWEKGKGSTLGNYVNGLCDCGNRKVVRADSLESGDTKSCGCIKGKPIGVKFYSLKTSEHPMYYIFHSMQKRCKNVNNTDYKYYGGRGIGICPEWDTLESESAFYNFLEDMESTYEKGLELERIDVNKDYTPRNCTWVCRKSQLNNLRRNRVLFGFGIELTVTEWGHFLGFNPKLLDDRINKGKDTRSLEKILKDTFKDKKHNLLYKGAECSASDIWSAEGYTKGQRNNRINKCGDSVTALREEGIYFEILKPREKSYKGFEEALVHLEDRTRDSFEDWLLVKIKEQLEDK